MTFGTQVAARLGKDDVARLDELVATGRFESRAEAVRLAVVALLDSERRRAIGEAIVAGYERVPQTREELAAAETNLATLIAEEPW
ncbi:MAG: ribbon-helix-helix domain-containing protein [Egibacteraceae bacterium]